MIRTHILPCHIPTQEADALNRESGRIYTGVVVEHWRAYRKSTKQWLSPTSEEKLSDFLTRYDTPLLHAHSKDAAQQGFAKAVNTTRALRKAGTPAHFPHRRKYYRTTIWKSTGIRLSAGSLLLARARGLAPIGITLPDKLSALGKAAFVEARLVYDRVTAKYTWHLVVEDGAVAPNAPGTSVIAVDMGEIHPAVCTDGATTLVISCKALRAARQYTQKRGAKLRSLQDTKVKGSRRWKRLKRRETRFRAKHKRTIGDLEHKISRAVVDYAHGCGAGIVAIGDVRDIADKTDKGHVQNQRMSTWAHGRIRSYITYKAEYAGMKVVLVDEAYTTQSCPTCRHRTKPKGRVYTCLACGFRGHRDAVGAANILSRHVYGELCRVRVTEPKYRHPYITGKRSSPGTGYLLQGMAWAGHTVQEAAAL